MVSDDIPEERDGQTEAQEAAAKKYLAACAAAARAYQKMYFFAQAGLVDAQSVHRLEIRTAKRQIDNANAVYRLAFLNAQEQVDSALAIYLAACQAADEQLDTEWYSEMKGRTEES